MEFCTAAPWAPRVVCSDASPGGHGLAWRAMDQHLVASMARCSEAPGRPDRDDLAGEVRPAPGARGPRRQVALPEARE
eukprot:653203-Lingulodinium_polyedra.AAC.1